jgi:hypothetical protein
MKRQRCHLSASARLVACVAAALCFTGCVSQEIVVLNKIEKGKIYVVGRILFENFQIEKEMLPEGKKICYVFFTKHEGDYLGMGQGLPESTVQTTWGRYFVHALKRSGSGTDVHRVSGIALSFQKDASTFAWAAGEYYELLFDLSFECGPEVGCVYVGDIVFSLRDNDMFVSVRDGYEGAREYFNTVFTPNTPAKDVALEKRLLTGQDFVELRRTSSNGSRLRFYPTF